MDELKQEKVIFFHMNQLGDLMFSLPLLSAARSQWKDKKLSSLVRPQYVSLLKATGFLDEVVPRPMDDLSATVEILSYFRKEDFKKAILFSESPETFLLSFVAAIPERYGFESAVFSFLLTKKAPRTGVPSLINNAALAKTLGLKDVPRDYTGLVRLPDGETIKSGEWLQSSGIKSEELVVIAPGASLRRREKHWFKDNWVKVIDYLSKKGFKPVLIGSLNELVDLKSISDGAAHPALIYPPQNDILPIAALISRAKFFIGIDSGAMHLAASLNVPVIALFGPTDPDQVGPQPLSKHIVVKKSIMEYIRVEDVVKAIDETIKKL
jgi:heptosyltransferase-2